METALQNHIQPHLITYYFPVLNQNALLRGGSEPHKHTQRSYTRQGKINRSNVNIGKRVWVLR